MTYSIWGPCGQEARGSEREDNQHVPVDQLALSMGELASGSRGGCGTLSVIYVDPRSRAPQREVA